MKEKGVSVIVDAAVGVQHAAGGLQLNGAAGGEKSEVCHIIGGGDQAEEVAVGQDLRFLHLAVHPTRAGGVGGGIARHPVTNDIPHAIASRGLRVAGFERLAPVHVEFEQAQWTAEDAIRRFARHVGVVLVPRLVHDPIDIGPAIAGLPVVKEAEGAPVRHPEIAMVIYRDPGDKG